MCQANFNFTAHNGAIIGYETKYTPKHCIHDTSTYFCDLPFHTKKQANQDPIVFLLVISPDRIDHIIKERHVSQLAAQVLTFNDKVRWER